MNYHPRQPPGLKVLLDVCCWRTSGMLRPSVCEPGFWRGCTRTQDSAGHDAGFVNASGQPCVLDFEQPCVQCGPHDVCVNDTLLHCPEHSLAPAGSDDARDCVCEGGYRAEY